MGSEMCIRDRHWTVDNGTDIGTGDVGQDSGRWTVGVTLGLLTWDRTWDCGQCGDIGTGDVGQDMGRRTVWVTGDRCLALVTCYNGLLQQGTNSGRICRPRICFLSSWPMEMEWNGFLSCWIFICINTYFKPDIKYIYYNSVWPQ